MVPGACQFKDSHIEDDYVGHPDLVHGQPCLVDVPELVGFPRKSRIHPSLKNGHFNGLYSHLSKILISHSNGIHDGTRGTGMT